MIIMIEIGLIVLGLVIIIGAFSILRSITHFVINAVVGLLILFIANSVAGIGIGYSWLVILICGIGGILGAILVLALHFMGIAF
jgi:SigmaK-factor processing regulatory protein BofA